MAKKERKKPGPSKNMLAVVEALRGAGFVEDGVTSAEQVRIPTVRNPVFGGVGGEIATFGGRLRFAHPNGVKATVGKVTTAIYRVLPKEHQTQFEKTASIWHGDTPDLDRIKQVLAEVTSV